MDIPSILLQQSTDQLLNISYSSRSSSEVEKRYSQMERELTSISEACEKNCFFSYGTDFTVYCDEKTLLSNPKFKLPPRLNRMILKVHGYSAFACCHSARDTFNLVIMLKIMSTVTNCLNASRHHQRRY